MSRIIIDARELSTSTGRYIERLIYYLQDIDTTNEYKILLKLSDFDSWNPKNANFVKVKCSYKEFSFGEQLGFARQLRKLRGDLVHFPMVQQPALYKGNIVTTMNDLTTTRFRNLAKNRFVFFIKQKIYIWLNKKVAKKSKAIITFSEYVKNDVVNFTNINPSKVSVTYLAADKIQVKPLRMKNLEGVKFLLYVGRPLSHKNLDRLVKAFSEVTNEHRDLHLILAGRTDLNYRRLEASVNKQKIPNVTFTGQISEGQLRWLYENCFAYLFPSLSEGFGLPGLEAMLHGAPVISSNATCLPEIYGDAAMYFDPLNVQSMTDAIKKVIEDEKLRVELITKGKQQVSKYSWRQMAQQTLGIYNNNLQK